LVAAGFFVAWVALGAAVAALDVGFLAPVLRVVVRVTADFARLGLAAFGSPRVRRRGGGAAAVSEVPSEGLSAMLCSSKKSRDPLNLSKRARFRNDCLRSAQGSLFSNGQVSSERLLNIQFPLGSSESPYQAL
jgi:hypothetical protein